MSVLRRVAISAAAAICLTAGAASTASAEIVPGLPGLPGLSGLLGGSGEKDKAIAPGEDVRLYGVPKDGGGLIEITDNNIGPFQACNNDVPINAVGGAGVISGLVGILSDDNSAELVRACSQDSTQDN